LDKATPLELQHYPLAVPGRSLILRANRSASYVFEAQSELSALRVVQGMRWVVARLAFNLIIGNLSVSSELLQPGIDASCADSYDAESAQLLAMNDVTNHLVNKSLV
jgi:hypothetical protein